jgi:hypothetical protein
MECVEEVSEITEPGVVERQDRTDEVRNWIVFSEEDKDKLTAKNYECVELTFRCSEICEAEETAYLFPAVKIRDLLEILPYPIPVERELAWSQVEIVLRNNFLNPDFDAVKMVCAALAAHKLEEYPPVWPLLIAPSGSMKTVGVDSLQGLPNVHFVDEVTTNTFISGKIDDPRKERRKTAASLLHRIGKNGIVIAADFSTVISSDKRTRSKILSQLRRIYDGHFRREFGSDENLEEREWEGRLTFIACVTPDIDNYHSVFQALGERFTRIRWDRAGGIAAGEKAMSQTSRVKLEMKEAVQRFLVPVIGQERPEAPKISQGYSRRIAALGEFVALARAVVPRQEWNHDIVDDPAPEGNTRLPQQLAQIGRGWALLKGRDEIDEEDFSLICRAAFDSILPIRRKILEAVMAGKSSYSEKVAAKGLISRTLEDLEMLNLIEPKEESGKKTYSLSPYAMNLLSEAGVMEFPKTAHDSGEERDNTR